MKKSSLHAGTKAILAMAGLLCSWPCTVHASPVEIVLFDGTGTEAFAEVSGFKLADGLLKGPQGNLVSKERYSNYELYIEFRNVNQGESIFINNLRWNLAQEDNPKLLGSELWQKIHMTYRNMPGERTLLTVPGYKFKAPGRPQKQYDEKNIRPAHALPRDKHGMVAGEADHIRLRFNRPTEIQRITLKALDPESPREFLELKGNQLNEFIAKGKEVYTTYCTACHNDGTGAALSPVNRSLGLDPMQNGSDRLSLYQTLTKGYKNMVPLPQLTAEQRHQVAAYVSDGLFKNHNASQYKPVDPETVAKMPYPLYTSREDFQRRNKPEDLVRQERGLFRDHGPLLVSPFGTEYRNAAHVLLDEDTAISYDLYGMNQVNTRTGAFLDMMRSHYFQQRPSSVVLPAGVPLPALNTWFWHTGAELKKPDKGLRNVPNGKAYAFKGYYLHERQAILSYEVKGRGILERPSVVTNSNPRIILQQLRVDAGSEALQLALAKGVEDSELGTPDSLQVIKGADGTLSLKVMGDAPGLSYTVESGFLLLNIPALDQAVEFTVVRSAGEANLNPRRGLADLVSEASRSLVSSTRTPDSTGKQATKKIDPATINALEPGRSLDECLTGGARRWPITYTMAGTLAENNAAYVMDTLPVPYENDYNAWMRTTSVAFFPDGRAVVTTHAGDVWVVSGIDQELKAVTWSRFAAGLYEAFGVKVVDGLIYVTTRNGIVRLHDKNNNGEADYYEQFFADPEVSSNWHGYNFDLVRDDQGYFYYSKNGQFTDIRMEGGALKVSPDGKSYSIFATGFRTPNGMGKLSDNRITYGENQGGWVPAGKLSIVKEGSWHGGAVRTSPEDRVPDPPLINFPQDVDNSCGGQLWIEDDRFGPYANMLMHTSCGHGRAMMIYMDEFGATSQAATQSFPFKFDSGVMRLAQNPAEGHVYLTGTRGWQINVEKDGCLQRIRYTGKPEALLMEVKARTGGIALGFNQPVDPASLKPEQFKVAAWNYKRSKSYGSKDYKPSQPDTVGRDTWTVSEVTVSGKNGIWIALPNIMPAQQVRIDYKVGFESGAVLANNLHMTIHALGQK